MLDYTIIATILSILGGFLVTSLSVDIRFYGYIIWIISNAIWLVYFYRTKQYNPAILFTIYLVTSIIGAYNNML